jgi:hypothetical protein
MSKPTMGTIQRKAQQLNKNIENLLVEFTQQTDVEVTGVSITAIHSMGHDTPVDYVVDTRLEMKIKAVSIALIPDLSQ